MATEDNDYMPGGEDAPPESPPKPDGDGKGKDDAEGESFLIPKSALHGEAEPGQTVTLKIVRAYDDEVECTVEKAEAPPAEGRSEMDHTTDSMDSLASVQE